MPRKAACAAVIYPRFAYVYGYGYGYNYAYGYEYAYAYCYRDLSGGDPSA